MPTLEEKYHKLRTEVRQSGIYRRMYGYYAAYLVLILLGIVAGFYVITLTDTLWVQLLNAIFLATVLVQAGMLGHDLSHGAVFESREKNRLYAKIVWGFLGGLIESMWYTKHTAHHESPNHEGHDPDLDIPFIFSLKQLPNRSRFFKRYVLPYQQYLFFLALPFVYLSWTINSQRFGFRNFSMPIAGEMLLAVLHHGIRLYFVFTYLPFLTAIVFLAVHFAWGGLYMSLVFAPNHKGEEVIGEDEEETWLNQITSTRNIYPSVVIFHFFGGLNFQVEHHLFPNIARPMMWKAHTLVKRFCIENKIRYQETTWLGSMREIYDSLKEMSKTAPTVQ